MSHEPLDIGVSGPDRAHVAEGPAPWLAAPDMRAFKTHAFRRHMAGPQPGSPHQVSEARFAELATRIVVQPARPDG